MNRADLSAISRDIDAAVSRLLGHPQTTSDDLLTTAESMTATGLDDRRSGPERLLWHAGAERLRKLAPIYAGRALRTGCPAGMGGE